MDPRVKIQRKRHHNKNNTNCKADRTATVKSGTAPVAESKQDGPSCKHRTKVKSSQSATTAATYVQASTQLMDPRVKIQRKRHHNKNNTNGKADRTVTVKPGTTPVPESKQDGPPSKHRTKVKSSQSGTTAATYVQVSTQLIDSRVKIQRKRRNRKNKTNGNAYTTVTTKPMPTQPGANISLYFITIPSIPPPDKDNESKNGDSKMKKAILVTFVKSVKIRKYYRCQDPAFHGMRRKEKMLLRT